MIPQVEIDTPPTTGNCETGYGGCYACKHIQLCGGEHDGCSVDMANDDPAIDGVWEGDCKHFSCSPAAMLKRLLKWSERLEKEASQGNTLASLVTDGMFDEGKEEEITEALEAVPRWKKWLSTRRCFQTAIKANN